MSFFKRRRAGRTLSESNFRNYKIGPFLKKKPLKQKKEPQNLPNDRAGKRRLLKLRNFKKILQILVFAGLICFLIYAALFTKILEIQKIDIVGDESTNDEQNAANLYLQKYLGRNLLLFPLRNSESSLLESYPYLKRVNLQRIPLHTIKVELETYKQLANVEILLESGDKKLSVINEQGNISALDTSNELLPTLVMDITGTSLEFTKESGNIALNKNLIEPSLLADLLESTSLFESKFNMEILSTHYKKRARELHLYTEREFFVWIDLTQEIESQFNKLKKAMTELNLYEAPLEYIDLRISGQNGDKVIYKLKEN